MRMHEIEENINTRLKKWFVAYGPAEIVDGLVNVEGSIKLFEKVNKLPIKFGKITGNFDCRSMALKTLEGFPEELTGTLLADGNPLTSLEGGPTIIGGDYNCQSCLLTSLKGAPNTVGDFICRENQLTSLEGGPEIVNGDFNVWHNPLTSLNGLPKEIHGDIYINYYEDMPLLRLLFVEKLGLVRFFVHQIDDNSAIVGDIINNYLGQGQGGALACAAELNRAGFRGNARR